MTAVTCARRRESRHGILALVAGMLWCAPSASAQPVAAGPGTPPGEPRTQAGVTVDLNWGDGGGWWQATPWAGVDIGRHWNVEVGLPVYVVRASATEDGIGVTGIGDLYASLSFDVSSERTTAYVTGTLGVPTGDAAADLGAGSATWDATGYLDHAVGRVTPSVEVGVGTNGLLAAVNPAGQLTQLDTYLLHAEGWAEVAVWRSVRLAAGAYVLRALNGDADAREASDDEGYQLVATTGIGRGSELSFWYSRSRSYAYDTFSVSCAVDILALFSPSRTSTTRGPSRR